MESAEFAIKNFREYINTHNFRHSITREAILLELWDCPHAKDADTLFLEMRRGGKNIKLSSIYNALSWLTQAGFLQKTMSQRKAMYGVLKESLVEVDERETRLRAR